MPTGRLLTALLFLTLQWSCTQTDPILRALQTDSAAIKRVTDNLAEHEVQILFSEVTRSNTGEVRFNTSEFQVEKYNYFYPASTVKFPVALLALEKLSEDSSLDRGTPFKVEGDSETTSVANEIKELFVVSDNEAYNRLFEFLGKDEINRRLSQKKIEGRISHRLSTPDSDVLHYKPLLFSTSTGIVVSQAQPSEPIRIVEANRLQKGLAYQENGETIHSPFDFSEKNFLPLRSLHRTMQRLIFPESFPEQERFRITKEDREFVLDSMSTLPKDAGYNDDEYYDSYVKFFLFGDSKDPMPSHIEIYNKVGYAYGTLTDCAYIVDKNTGKEFLITATLLVNENKIFNDDNYEYETIGIPFLAELGRQLVRSQ